MKKLVLTFVALLLMVSTVEANNSILTTSSNEGYVKIHKASPIQFVEKGIKFSVYPNGTFDFVSNSRAFTPSRNAYSYNKYYGNSYRNNLYIIKDRYGRIVRVNNVLINYNRAGNVTQIGSVDIDYHRNRMTQIGNLHIVYNRSGYVKYIGSVKPRFDYRVYRYDSFYNGMILDFDDDYFFDDHFYNDFDDYDEDDNFYYYKSKKDDAKVIKRKKGHDDELNSDRKRRS